MPPVGVGNGNLKDSIGFSNFPNQVFRRCIRNGFEFSLMVVGQSGLGKSTFINSLFLAEIYDKKKDSNPPAPIKQTVEINSKTLCLQEEDVRFNVTFVDTPGFGDHVNNTDCWKPIVKYIDDRFAAYLNEETKIERPPRIEDRRVHLCLYFVSPLRGLTELDIEAMKALQDRVNIVPVIGLADMRTSSELKEMKEKMMDDFVKHEIRLYEFPAPESKNDMKDHRNRIPFAVVGSNELKDNGKTKMRVRTYEWGTVEVDNLKHNDFLALRDLLVNQSMIDLIAVTREVHYENFRTRQMQKYAKEGGILIQAEEDPFTRMEREQRLRKREMEVAHAAKEKIFADKVAEREKILEQKEQDIRELEKKYAAILQNKKQELEAVQQLVRELRQATSMKGSFTSLNPSPDAPIKKKKSSTLSLFR